MGLKFHINVSVKCSFPRSLERKPAVARWLFFNWVSFPSAPQLLNIDFLVKPSVLMGSYKSFVLMSRCRTHRIRQWTVKVVLNVKSDIFVWYYIVITLLIWSLASEDGEKEFTHAVSAQSLCRSSSMEMISGTSEEYQDCCSSVNSTVNNGMLQYINTFLVSVVYALRKSYEVWCFKGFLRDPYYRTGHFYVCLCVERERESCIKMMYSREYAEINSPLELA